jgi:hypothetical protein
MAGDLLYGFCPMSCERVMNLLADTLPGMGRTHQEA